MSAALVSYREMEVLLDKIRDQNGGGESEEEMLLLQQMDVVWRQLTKAERRALARERS